MDRIIVRLLRLPSKVYGVTVKDENDDYNIYINSVISQERQQKALKHELYHIKKGHFYSNLSIKVIEKETEAETR